jgi:hypothetical protein
MCTGWPLPQRGWNTDTDDLSTAPETRLDDNAFTKRYGFMRSVDFGGSGKRFAWVP